MADEKKSEGKKVKRPSAKKRDLQALARNAKNRSYKAKVTTMVRSLKESIAKKDAPAVKTQLDAVYSLMDKGVKTGAFKLNKAGRVKSRLHQLAHAK